MVSHDEAEWSHAERLADLLLERLESLRLPEHEEATILTAIARRLVRRTVELGEVIENEARELNDLSALQMATALQALGPCIEQSLELIETHRRFGLMPARQSMRLSAPPPTAHHDEATGTNSLLSPRPLFPQRQNGPRGRQPQL